MKIEKIKLKDFRQFIGKNQIEFSLDDIKNVNIIFGDNGSGKTTLAQAFIWCLYNTSNFKDDKYIINKKKFYDLNENEELDCYVEIELIHDNNKYTINRTVIVKKIGGTLKKISNKQTVDYINENGQTVILTDGELKPTIDKIIPANLSRFFFFDGERIQRISQDLTNGKEKELSKDIDSILGLNAFKNALKHLNPDFKNSVVSLFKNMLGETSNEELKNVIDQVNINKDKIDILKQEISEINNYILKCKEKVRDNENIINKNAEGRNKQSLKKKNKEEINHCENMKKDIISDLITNINKYSVGYLSRPLLGKILENLKENNFKTDLPNIHSNVIKKIIENKECFCGTKITENSKEMESLINLIELLPPQSIGISINNFCKEMQNLLDYSEDFFDFFKKSIIKIQQFNKNIETIELEIEKIDKEIIGIADIAKIEMEKNKLEKKIDDYSIKINKINKEIGGKEFLIKDLEKKIDILSRDQRKTQKINNYIKFTKHSYNYLKSILTTEENIVRENLEISINKIFKKLYDEGFNLKLNENKTIDVRLSDVESKIETSQGQNMAIIFAYIVGIINFVKEKRVNNAENPYGELIPNEPYPLVMDATFSFFDKKRIKNVCDTIPEISEQIILFIKDTDGDVAKSFLSDKIGKEYKIFKNKNSKFPELETVIKEIIND